MKLCDRLKLTIEKVKKGNSWVLQCDNFNKNALSFHIFCADNKLRKSSENVLKLGKPLSFLKTFKELDYFPGTV